MSDSDVPSLGDTPGGTPGDSRDTKSTRVRRLKACKQCHLLKVRCTPLDESDPASPCVRCVNANKVCEIDSIQRRKRRKRVAKKELETVAELRGQIAELQEQLRAAHHRPAPAAGDARSPPHDVQLPLFMTKSDLEKEVGILAGTNVSLKDISENIKQLNTQRTALLAHGQKMDVVLLGIISLDEARVRLDLYHTKIYNTHPLVELPEGMPAETLLDKHPFLFNSVMAIASMVYEGYTEYDTALRLENQAVMLVVTEVMVNGSKTVELVKSLILLSIWYNTPEFFKLRRYHILNNAAVTLLHDLGILDRACFTYNNEKKLIEKGGEDYRSMDYRSLILTLYFSTVSICLILRRAIFVKWTPYVEESCTMLELSGNPRYRDLALFLRLNHELERIHHIIHLPDVTVNKPRISKYELAEFQTKLAILKSKLLDTDHRLLAYYYSVEAYLHQPLFEDLQVNQAGQIYSQDLEPHTLSSIAHCTASCLFALDEFNKLTIHEISALPLFYCSRVIYTAGILMRLRYYILSLPSLVEKELVPRYAIFAILKVNLHIGNAANVFSSNFFLKKMILIVQLFIQTYVTQVKELLRKNHGIASQSSMYPKDIKVMASLASAMTDPDTDNLSGEKHRPGLHLDLLSYAAAAFRKSAEGSENGNVALDPDANKAPSPVPPENVVPPLMGVNREPPLLSSTSPQRQPPAPMPPVQLPFPDMHQGAPFQRAHHPMGNNVSHNFSSLRLPSTSAPPGDVNASLGNAAFQQQLEPNTQANPNALNGFPPVAGLNVGDGSDSFFYFDDEFWSNLLSTSTDKIHFAQSPPPPSENVLFLG